jgi:hypothetical protein
LTAGRLALLVATSSERPVRVELPGSSPERAHGRNIRRVRALQDPAVPVRLVDVPDLGQGLDLALLGLVVLAGPGLRAVLHLRVRLPGRNALRTIVAAVVGSSIRRPRKAR